MGFGDFVAGFLDWVRALDSFIDHIFDPFHHREDAEQEEEDKEP